MSTLPPVVARLFADARQFEATMAKSDATMTKFGNTALTAGEKMNKAMNSLAGKARKYAIESQEEVFNEVDGGEDDKMNRIIWFYSKGNEKYPDIK